MINNAADFDLSIKQPVLTKDGLEKQFATNVVDHFLLSQSFIPLWKESESGRILNISSQGLQAYPFIKLNFENLKGEQSYSPSKTYYQNKLALLMLTLAMRARNKDVTIQAIKVPSIKVDMKRYSHLSSFMKNLYKLKSRFSISPEEMAKPISLSPRETAIMAFYTMKNAKRSKPIARLIIKRNKSNSGSS